MKCPRCHVAPPSSPTLASDHPHVFKKDVVERAKAYTAGLGGGVGAYTNSQGIPAVREVNYLVGLDYIDNYNYNVIY